MKFITSIMINDVAVRYCENFEWFGYRRCETVHLLSPTAREAENRRLNQGITNFFNSKLNAFPIMQTP
jgi:hypothetical protein